MYISYDDIVSRIEEEPVWWLDGLPRFEPFTPSDATIHGAQVALVHTECQDCRRRYDVAVLKKRLGGDLRNLLAYSNDLDIGDPPNALHHCWAGHTMGSLEIAVLEFWERPESLKGWERDATMERPLADADWDGTGAISVPTPCHLSIRDSDRSDEWNRAREDGDFEKMIAILSDFGCERPIQVANILDIERRYSAHTNELIKLYHERLKLG